MAAAGGTAPCKYPNTCFIVGCSFEHTAAWCPAGDSCGNFYCTNRHSKQRQRCCKNGANCQRHDCHFLHPVDSVIAAPVQALQATAVRSRPQQQPAGALDARPQPCTTSSIVRITGFGTQATDLSIAREKLAEALTVLSHQCVVVDIPNLAEVQHSNAEVFAYFDSASAAQAAALWLGEAVQASSFGLGGLRAEVHYPNEPGDPRASSSGSAQVAGPGRASPGRAGPGRASRGRGGGRNGTAPRGPPSGGRQIPQQMAGHSSQGSVTQAEGVNSVPGVAELRALPRHPALAHMWDRMTGVLSQHQQKVVQAEQELHKLSDEPSFVRASGLKAAQEAIQRLQKELEQQRLVFLEYVARCLKADMPPERTLAALSRELYRLEGALPALAVRREFEDKVQAGQFVVVKGETGSGKSTQLPQYLADMRGIQGQVIVTQPRKIAAEELAKRVAIEYAAGDYSRARGEEVVGFHVGGKRNFNPQKCRIKYMTEAVLLNEMLQNADLRRYGAIIVDEAHERSINTDVLLGLLKRDIHKYPDLKICVTSATIETEKFCSFFGQAGSLEIPGRMFPVMVKHVHMPGAQDLARTTVAAVLKILDETAAEHVAGGPANQNRGGDVLVFLTGQEDVEKATRYIEASLRDPKKNFKHLRDHVVPMALYGQQTSQKTQAAVAKGVPEKRRVVFATNVAETSLTIDGVTVVVDAGFTKEALYDHQKRMKILQAGLRSDLEAPALQTLRIAQSSAKQRQGRAGRTAPGMCYRLYSEEDMMAMQPSQTAEILRSPLELTVLNLKQLGIDAQQFDWLEAPDKVLLDTAVQQLRYLQALEPNGAGFKLTPFGKLVISLQARLEYTLTFSDIPDVSLVSLSFYNSPSTTFPGL
ncbi:TPA: hypothetical protein ACH3X2_011173 [Trebouxia sp. C0005]